MTLVHFNPLYEINSLQRQMSRLLEDIATWDQGEDESIFKPAVELKDNDSSLTLRVSIPGMDKDNLDVSVTRDQVKITGKFEHKKEEEDEGYYISEFNYKEFERIINLPVPIKNEEVTAEYNDGILVLKLPKFEDKTHKVFKVHLGGNGKKVLDTEKQ